MMAREIRTAAKERSEAMRRRNARERRMLGVGSRALRAFSFTHDGKGGLVYWAVGSKDPPAIDLSALGLSVRADGARRFVTADVPEADLVIRFKAALDRLGICFTTKGSQK